jgi:hypothetical protein
MGKSVDYHSNPQWLYSGDVNAEHGGIWIKHQGDYAEFVRITDLDSACGFTGAVMIERGTTGLYACTPRENIKRIRDALECVGMGVATLGGLSRPARHACIWDAMISYGACDTDETATEILQLEPGAPMEFESWAAERVQAGDIGGYVMAKFLD